MNRTGTSLKQTTIEREIVLKGIGVHGGREVSMVLHPARENSGYTFYVNKGDAVARVPGDFRAVSNVTLCTVVGNDNGQTVSTVEHLLAALRGLNIDNVDVELDGEEIPIMDGSAEPFVDAIDEAGVRELDANRRYIKVLRPVRVEDGDAWGELHPYDGFRVDVEIDFKTPLIGHQRIDVDVTPRSFVNKLCRARTFGFMKDVKYLWSVGRALGASLDNTVALGDDRIMNPEGLRFPNEFVRHKALDAVGDLALAGAPILGYFRSSKGGHKLNSAMLHALYANKDAWTISERAAEPLHRPTAPRADLAMAFAEPNFAPTRD
jgi:UDP-3-O-[3-hydroxymyristoyl] N-acetylglucosamine deacetylase